MLVFTQHEEKVFIYVYRDGDWLGLSSSDFNLVSYLVLNLPSNLY